MRLYPINFTVSADRKENADSILRFTSKFLDTNAGYLMFKHELYRMGATQRVDL